MNAAFKGPRKDRLKTCAHHFNVKVAKIIGALGIYWQGKPVPADSILYVQRKVERVIFGNWRSGAEFIVTNIAIRACTRTKKDVLSLHRGGKLSKRSFQAARIRGKKPKPRPRTKPNPKPKVGRGLPRLRGRISRLPEEKAKAQRDGRRLK